MNSRLFQESLIIRFLKQLYHYAQNSYLFHFDFKIDVSKKSTPVEKPKGLFESLLILVGEGFSACAKAVSDLLEGSYIYRFKKGFLKDMHRDPVSSVLYFALGFILLYGVKSPSTGIFTVFIGLAVFTTLLYPLFKKYGEGSLVLKTLMAFLSGGDKS